MKLDLNPADHNPKNVVVMDRATADWLAQLFPGAKVVAMAGIPQPVKGRPGRKAVHKNNRDRTHAWRASQRQELLDQLARINEESFEVGTYPELDQNSCDEMTLYIGENVTPKSNGSLFCSIYDPLSELDLGVSDADKFIALLRALHERVLAAKEDSGLIAPAQFDPDASEATCRGLDNVVHVKGIWLDNDGGDLSHHEFTRLFPYLRIVAWNTYSHTPAKPRWRAFIPTSLAMTKDVHKLLMRQIESVLNKNGYWTQKELDQRPNIKRRLVHGFDKSKFTACSLFYLPCQAANPRDSFFVDYNDDDRAELDVVKWLDECARKLELDPEPDPEPAPSPQPVIAKNVSAQLIELGRLLREQKRSRPHHIIEEATSEWRQARKGDGHAAFFKLACALQRAGLDDHEMTQKLRDEAAYAYSSNERRAEIKGIVKKLARTGWIR